MATTKRHILTGRRGLGHPKAGGGRHSPPSLIHIACHSTLSHSHSLLAQENDSAVADTCFGSLSHVVGWISLNCWTYVFGTCPEVPSETCPCQKIRKLSTMGM